MIELTPQILIAQAIGLCSALLFITATQQKETRRILQFNGMGGVLIAANLFMLGGTLSAGVAIIAACRNFIIATQFGDRWKNYIIPLSLAAILSLTLSMGITNWGQSFIIIGPIFGSIAYIQHTMFKVRGFLFLCESTWLINALVFGSIGGIILGFAVTSGHFIAIVRYCRDSILDLANSVTRLLHLPIKG